MDGSVEPYFAEGELLPCPYCGGEADVSEGSRGDGTPWWYVECVDCAAITEPDVWNRRAPQSAELPLIKALEAIRDLPYYGNSSFHPRVIKLAADALEGYRAPQSAIGEFERHIVQTKWCRKLATVCNGRYGTASCGGCGDAPIAVWRDGAYHAPGLL